MYGRSRRYYRARRRREEIRGYMRTLVWVLTVICILVVAVAMAVQTKASMVVAAEVTEESILIDESKVIDLAQVMTSGQELAVAAAVESVKVQDERVIVIDPGHGGMDGGCVFEDVLEKEINRKIAYRVVQKLRDMGYKVELARKGDDFVDKEDRVEAANRQNACLYVSIHQNSCEIKSVSGIETWYDDSDASGDSKRLAQLIQQETVKATGGVGRELVPDTELCVLNKSNMPACLIETGFLSNKKEREKLNTMEYRDQIAEGIAKGIDLYLNSKIIEQA